MSKPVLIFLLASLLFITDVQQGIGRTQSPALQELDCGSVLVFNQSDCIQSIYGLQLSKNLKSSYGDVEPGENLIIIPDEDLSYIYTTTKDSELVTSGVTMIGCNQEELTTNSCLPLISQDQVSCEFVNSQAYINNNIRTVTGNTIKLECGEPLILNALGSAGVVKVCLPTLDTIILNSSFPRLLSSSIGPVNMGEYTLIHETDAGCVQEKPFTVLADNCCGTLIDLPSDTTICSGGSIALAADISGQAICVEEKIGYSLRISNSDGRIEAGRAGEVLGAPDNNGPRLFGFASSNSETFITVDLGSVVTGEIIVYAKVASCIGTPFSKQKFSISIASGPGIAFNKIGTIHQELTESYEPYSIKTNLPFRYVRIEDERECKIRIDAIGYKQLLTNTGSNYKWNNIETEGETIIDQAGSYQLSVQDCKGCMTTKSINVSEVNCSDECDKEFYSPNAENDIFRICDSQLELDGDVSINDSDPNNFELQYSIETNAEFGTVTLESDGKFNYSFEGAIQDDNFTYKVCKVDYIPCRNEDEDKGCSIGSVSIAKQDFDFILGDDFSVCEGEVSILSVPSIYGALWSTGQTTNTIAVNTGTFRVTVTSQNGCSFTDNITIDKISKPSSNIIVSNALSCSNESTILSAAGGVSYLWNTGQGGESISVSEAGEYFVTITNSNGCTTVTGAEVFSNFSSPRVEIQGDNSICSANQQTILTATGSGDSYLWSNGAVGRSIAVAGVGTYSVTATDDQSGCEDSNSFQVSMIENYANAGSDFSTCSGETVIIGGSELAPDGATYQWSNGASGIIGDDETGRIAVRPQRTTTFTLTSIIGGCALTDEITVFVEDFTVEVEESLIEICRGSTAILTANGADTYEWSTGQNGNLISVSPNVTTEYTVRGISSVGCSAERKIEVVVIDDVQGTLAESVVACPGEVVSLVAGGGSFYEWSNGGVGSTINVSALTQSSFSVTISNEFGCEDIKDITFNIREPELLDLVSDQEICLGSTTTLEAPLSESYIWNTGETTQRINVEPNEDTEYSVMYVDGGCQFIENIAVSVNQSQIIDLGEDLIVCAGEEITLTAPIAESYLWQDGTTSQTLTVSPTTETLYSLVASINGCQSTGEVNVQIREIGNIDIGDDKLICPGESVSLFAPISDNYLWSTGETSQSIQVSPIESTEYSVTITNDGCGDRGTISVLLRNREIIDIGGDRSICKGTSVEISAPENGEEFLWSTGETSQRIIVSPDTNTVYSVVYRSGGCEFQGNISIEIQNCPGVITGTVNNTENQGIAGSLVELLNYPDRLAVLSVFTNSNGFYSFNSVSPGLYYIRQTNLLGYRDVSSIDESQEVGEIAQFVTNVPVDDEQENLIPVAIEVNETDSDNNFVDQLVSSEIKGFAMLDTDGDLIADLPFINVTILLETELNELVATAITNSLGYFEFLDVSIGDYILSQELPEGYQSVYDTDETISASDPDGADVEADNSIKVSLEIGEIDDGNTFLSQIDDPEPGTISGFSYLEEEQSDGLTLVPYDEVKIELLDANGELYDQTETDETGYYEFVGVAHGAYQIIQINLEGVENVSDFDNTVDEDDMDGFDENPDNMIEVILDPGEFDGDNNFIDRVEDDLGLGIIEGFVYELIDGDEIGMEGSVLDLFTNQNQKIGSTLTDENGFYTFTDLEAGQYIILETDQKDENGTTYRDKEDRDRRPDDPSDGASSTPDDRITVILDPGETDDGNIFLNEKIGNNLLEECDVFQFDDFSSGFGDLWIDGGSEVERTSRYSFSSRHSIELSNDKGAASSIFTIPKDYSENNSVGISFYYQVRGNVENEYFLFEVSNDGGASYKEVQRWVYDDDFDLAEWIFESVIVQKADLQSNTSFRIRSNFSSFADRVYIDDLKIELCHPLGTSGETEGDFVRITADQDLNSDAFESDKITISEFEKSFDNNIDVVRNNLKAASLTLYPNPASDWLTIDLGANYSGEFGIEIISSTGNKVLQLDSFNQSKEIIDISDIPSNQLYMIIIKESNKAHQVRRFFKY